MGNRALASNTIGIGNTATAIPPSKATSRAPETPPWGVAPSEQHEGETNTAMGFGALEANIAGRNNTALGRRPAQQHQGTTTPPWASAPRSRHRGSNNIAIGVIAGLMRPEQHPYRQLRRSLMPESSASAPRATRRPPSSRVSAAHRRRRGAVLVDGDGQLGTTVSSRRAKDDIRDMDDASAGLGSFAPSPSATRRSPPWPDVPIEYGLIAEEVAEIYPELVVLDKDGQPAGVRYHVLPAMLLNELQRQQRVIEAQAAQARSGAGAAHRRTDGAALAPGGEGCRHCRTLKGSLGPTGQVWQWEHRSATTCLAGGGGQKFPTILSRRA